jgi:pleuromutilin/lincosamide/streptogramin A transport system ATP-binding/permease protein
MQKKYLMIYHDLVEQINNDMLPTSSLLPSEHDLAEIYQTSRETIRKALAVENKQLREKLAKGGERVKVAFAKLFVSDINTLILDEPTNFLDIEAVEA